MADLTPFLARENAISAIGPWAGIESLRERWMTVRIFLTCSFVVPFEAGTGLGLEETPYMSLWSCQLMVGNPKGIVTNRRLPRHIP